MVDGKVGKDLENGDVISISYSTSSGTGANGLKVFENIGTFRDNLGNAITSGIFTTATSFPDGGARAETQKQSNFLLLNSILHLVEQFLHKIMKQFFHRSIQT